MDKSRIDCIHERGLLKHRSRCCNGKKLIKCTSSASEARGVLVKEAICAFHSETRAGPSITTVSLGRSLHMRTCSVYMHVHTAQTTVGLSRDLHFSASVVIFIIHRTTTHNYTLFDMNPRISRIAPPWSFLNKSLHCVYLVAACATMPHNATQGLDKGHFWG